MAEEHPYVEYKEIHKKVLQKYIFLQQLMIS